MRDSGWGSKRKVLPSIAIMNGPRVIEVRIQGLRTLADVQLSTHGLTVLVGANGSGKSSILQALEMLRSLPDEQSLRNLVVVHGPPVELLRAGESTLKLGIGFAIESATYWYGVGLRAHGASWIVEHEHLYRGSREKFVVLLRRDGASFDQELDPMVGNVGEHALALSSFSRHADARAAIDALRGIEVHLPFRTSAAWALRAAQLKAGMRDPAMLGPAERLELFGENLAEAFHALRNRGRKHWDDTLGLVRLGLGPALSDVVVESVARGYGELAVDFDGLGRIPASGLSDGQLSFLALVAAIRLDRKRTLLAFDEPDASLHPGTIVRLVELLEAASADQPVVIATQSDRLLDALSEPIDAALICTLDDAWRTRTHRLDAGRYSAWVNGFRGLGDVRAQGDLELLVTPAETPSDQP